MFRGLGCVLAIGFLLAPTAMSKVYIRWAQRRLPAPNVLGVSELVIPWNDEAYTLMSTAKGLGYAVYLEASLDQAVIAAQSSASWGAAGIILRGYASQAGQLQDSARQLRVKYPKLRVLVLSSGGKQPKMRGWLVFQRDGILQVSSPSSQPWLDQNLAVVRFDRAFDAGKTPLYSFSWDVSDPLVKEQGPTVADYSLAIAEAGAFRADLVLELYERQQKDLASGDPRALADWEQVKRTIGFYQREVSGEEAAVVAVLTDDYDTSYEAINLMARHNIPFRVFRSADTKAADLAGFSVVIAFATLKKDQVEAVRAFAQRGGTAVLVNLHGTYPWDSVSAEKKNGPSVTYTVGKGRVIELGEAVSDPETFAQDVRRLLVKEEMPVGLWNSLTTLVVEYRGASGATVELVNYDEEPTQVQVQVKGSFSSVRYESPEQGCCQDLKASHVDGATEFVVPNIVTGGRVRLEGVQKAASLPALPGPAGRSKQ
jgi:hypothetical protein